VEVQFYKIQFLILMGIVVYQGNEFADDRRVAVFTG